MEAKLVKGMQVVKVSKGEDVAVATIKSAHKRGYTLDDGDRYGFDLYMTGNSPSAYRNKIRTLKEGETAEGVATDIKAKRDAVTKAWMAEREAERAELLEIEKRIQIIQPAPHYAGMSEAIYKVDGGHAKLLYSERVERDEFQASHRAYLIVWGQRQSWRDGGLTTVSVSGEAATPYNAVKIALAKAIKQLA